MHQALLNGETPVYIAARNDNTRALEVLVVEPLLVPCPSHGSPSFATLSGPQLANPRIPMFRAAVLQVLLAAKADVNQAGLGLG